MSDNPHQMKRLKTGAFERRLSMAMAGFVAGTRLAAGTAGSLFASPGEREETRRRVMAEQAHAFAASINERARQVIEAEQFSLRSRAAKAVDEIWRSKNMVPCCPHCNRGLLPEHFADGVKKSIGKDFARQQEKAFRK